MCDLPAQGEIDEEAGEFWVANALLMPKVGANLSAYERNKMYLNVNGSSFLDVSYVSGVDLDSDSRSIVVADFNRDGLPDILVGSVGGGPLRLFRNQTAQGMHRVRLNLRSVHGGRPAIGARVILECGDRQIVRDLYPANGFMGQAPAELLIGVGQAERIDHLTVRWPDGRTQEWDDLPVDRSITIREGEEAFDVGQDW